MSEEETAILRQMMRTVVTEGTASALAGGSYTAAGKTGSAEYSADKSDSHAWFTGFAEGNNGKKIAISVIIENGGSGGQVAIPVARAVFDSYFNR